MQLKDFTRTKDSSKNLDLFTEDDIKSMEDIKEKMESYLEKGESIEEEIRKSKAVGNPSIQNSLENIKETITESVIANATKEAIEKAKQTTIGSKVMKTVEKPIQTVKNILTKAGGVIYKVGKVILTK